MPLGATPSTLGTSDQYDPNISYSYAELRKLCKAAGVSAAGKASELRVRLAQAHATDANAPTASAPAAIDMAAKAISTPLPSRQSALPHIKTRVDARKGTTRPCSLLTLLLKALTFLAAIVYALDKRVCKMPAFVNIGPLATSSCEAASMAMREATSALRRLADASPVDIKSFDLKTLLIKGVEDAHASLLDKIDGKTKIPFEPLNKAVLEMFMVYNSGLDSVVSHLEDVWSGRHVSSNDKANAVIFACLGSQDCTEVEADISAVADPTSVLKVLVDERTTRGEVQTQIATFLKETPSGVVIVPRVERWSPVLLSVLNNCMGEGGSLIQDGVAVPTTSATWLLTARVALNSEMTSSSVKLSLGVKGALLEGRDETDEMVQAVLMAFRRRLDVVALGTFVS